jgi:hypothetical protein
MGVAEFHETGALGILDDPALKRDRSQFVGLSLAWAHAKLRLIGH